MIINIYYIFEDILIDYALNTQNTYYKDSI